MSHLLPEPDSDECNRSQYIRQVSASMRTSPFASVTEYIFNLIFDWYALSDQLPIIETELRLTETSILEVNAFGVQHNYM